MMPSGKATLISCNWPNSRMSALRSITTSALATPASTSRAATSCCNAPTTWLIADAARSWSNRTGWLRTCSNDKGAARNPNADAAPDAGGTSTSVTPKMRATPTAWAGPAPPNPTIA